MQTLSHEELVERSRRNMTDKEARSTRVRFKTFRCTKHPESEVQVNPGCTGVWCHCGKAMSEVGKGKLVNIGR